MAVFNQQSGLGYGSYSKYESKPRRLPPVPVIVGVIAALFIGVVFVVLNSLASGPKQDFTILAVREGNLQAFITGHQSSIGNADMGKLNAEASLFLGTNSRTLYSELANLYGVSQAPDPIVAAETDTTSAGQRNNAALVNRYDSTYRQIVREKLLNTLTLAQKVQSETSNQRVSSELTVIIGNLQRADKEYAALGL